MRYFFQIIFLLVYTLCISTLSALQCWSYNATNELSNLSENGEYIEHTYPEDDINSVGKNARKLDQELGNMSRITNCSIKYGCFVLWKMNSNKTFIITQGCFINSGPECEGQDNCVDTSAGRKEGYLFCCCQKDLCNENFSWEPAPAPPTTELPKVEPDSNISFYLAYMLFLLSMALLFVLMCLLRKRKIPYFNPIPNMDQHQQSLPPTPRNEKLRPIHLEEIKARGKFGAVWKATDKNETVAVKIMSINDKQAWLTEQEIFKLPCMNHENILRFIAAEKRGENMTAEFWLITAYHPLGSLHDFLKTNTITWEQFLMLGYTMARGLRHLHEILPEKGDGYKPAIAHRDFKSSNVLIKNDLTACIADFGLALIFKPHRACGDTHGQVGTRRYMAPEVLEGAINFSSDSFLRIDMYAFGLVLWELASRCNFQQGPVPDYKLPFEEEVGKHPSLEDMQEIVVQQKRRPVIKPNWLQHPAFVSLQCSMEECWDHDAEARVTASCIMERFIEHIKLSDSPSTPLLLINNNLTMNAAIDSNTDGNPYLAV